MMRLLLLLWMLLPAAGEAAHAAVAAQSMLGCRIGEASNPGLAAANWPLAIGHVIRNGKLREAEEMLAEYDDDSMDVGFVVSNGMTHFHHAARQTAIGMWQSGTEHTSAWFALLKESDRHSWTQDDQRSGRVD